MMNKFRKACTALTVTALATTALALTAPSAVAKSTSSGTPRLVFTSGTTSLALAKGTAAALTKAGVTVATASSARAGKYGIGFPITGGVLNPKTLAGSISHSGGLTFTAGGKSLTVRDFRISTTTARLSAYADEAKIRIRLLDLSLAKAKISASGHNLHVTNVSATLDAAAAKALDSYFSTTLFTKGLPIGTARVDAKVTTLYTH